MFILTILLFFFHGETFWPQVLFESQMGNFKLQNITDYPFSNLNSIQNFSNLGSFVSFLETHSELELQVTEGDRWRLDKALSDFNILNTHPLQGSCSSIELELKFVSVGGALKCQLSS